MLSSSHQTFLTENTRVLHHKKWFCRARERQTKSQRPPKYAFLIRITDNDMFCSNLARVVSVLFWSLDLSIDVNHFSDCKFLEASEKAFLICSNCYTHKNKVLMLELFEMPLKRPNPWNAWSSKSVVLNHPLVLIIKANSWFIAFGMTFWSSQQFELKVFTNAYKTGVKFQNCSWQGPPEMHLW